MKRNTLIFFALLCMVFFVFGCSKELSLENSASTISAEGSLWDTAGICLPDSVHGTFYTGVQPGGDTAYVEITKLLRPVVKSIMYGEPCSTVPIYKKANR